MCEMILCGEKTLEAIIQTEDEIKMAIESLLEMPVGNLEDIETISPVIEQQHDPESYESTSYTIDTGYGSSSYDSSKNYYELIMGDGEDNTIGASMTAIYSEHHHELLQDVHEIASKTRQSDESKNAFIEPHVDFNAREKKDSVKLLSVAVWQSMYDGKLIYN